MVKLPNKWIAWINAWINAYTLYPLNVCVCVCACDPLRMWAFYYALDECAFMFIDVLLSQSFFLCEVFHTFI